MPLARHEEAPHGLRYGIDLDALDTALARPEVTSLLWCSPHNPTGRVWTRDELRAVAECCVRHEVFVMSDEVWGELVLEPELTPFVGMASLVDEVPGLREKLVVVTSTSKTYNGVCVGRGGAGVNPHDHLHATPRRRLLNPLPLPYSPPSFSRVD